MRYVSVAIELDEIVEQLDDDDFIKEAKSRDLTFIEACTTPELNAALDESAMILRKQGRADLAFRLDELRKEL